MISKNQKYPINKGYRKLVSLFIRRIYQDNVKDLTRSIIVVGSARSGTTWLANLIASEFHSRIMFKPFNSNLVPLQQFLGENISPSEWHYLVMVVDRSTKNFRLYVDGKEVNRSPQFYLGDLIIPSPGPVTCETYGRK